MGLMFNFTPNNPLTVGIRKWLPHTNLSGLQARMKDKLNEFCTNKVREQCNRVIQIHSYTNENISKDSFVPNQVLQINERAVDSDLSLKYNVVPNVKVLHWQLHHTIHHWIITNELTCQCHFSVEEKELILLLETSVTTADK